MSIKAKVLLIVGVIVLIPMLIMLWGIGTALNTTQEIVEKTVDVDNVIYNYEWFKETWEDIQALEKKIENAEMNLNTFKENAGEPKDWNYSISEEINRLNGICLGLRNQRADVIAKYNARSKMANRNIFKGKSLPLSIDIE